MDLRVLEVSKKYITPHGIVEVLRKVDFNICSGETVVILGPNGSGKSTLLEIVAGLIQADEGQVIVDGKPVKDPGRDRAIVFQEHALFDWLTVQGNLEYVLDVRKAPHNKRDILCAKYLQIFQLYEFRKVFPKQISIGMRQRLAIARALIGDPQILLLDEPFASVDAIARHQLQLFLIDIINLSNLTTLFVTHSVEEALTLAKRIIVFGPRPGRVIEMIDVPGFPGGERLRLPEIKKLFDYIWRLLQSL